MPELPEVEMTMRALKPKIVGRRILDFAVFWPRGLKARLKDRDIAADVRGKKIRALRRNGKVLFMDLASSSRRNFAIHLRMSGSLVLDSGVSRAAYARFIWKLSGNKELSFNDPRKFGVVWYGTPEELSSDKYLRTLGPDAALISSSDFFGRIRGHNGALKPLLLKQNVIAGIGNIMADEILWDSKLHPQYMTGELSESEIGRIYRSMRKIIKRTLAAKGNSLRDWIMPDGTKGESIGQLKAYGRAGLACARCGGRIERIVIGGRGTHICIKCQTY